MTNGNDDAFAWVVLQHDGTTTGESGLTKREYFAAMAMQGFVVGDHLFTNTKAKLAVEMADALIAALNETK